MEETAKVFWKSKTLIAALLMAGASLYPPVAAWIAANPTVWATLSSAIFGSLRLMTNEPVTFKKQN